MIGRGSASGSRSGSMAESRYDEEYDVGRGGPGAVNDGADENPPLNRRGSFDPFANGHPNPLRSNPVGSKGPVFGPSKVPLSPDPKNKKGK